MLKRENEFEKDKRIEEMNDKYNLDELFEKMRVGEEKMKQEKSCGCVVWDDGKILLIKSVKGHWDLPKGHVEGEETEEETAIRELKEETNIDVEIISDEKLQTEYSPEEGVWKKVIYFAAKKIGGELRPQEEEVEQVKWFSKEEALETLTFENTRKILQQMLEKNLFKQ